MTRTKVNFFYCKDHDTYITKEDKDEFGNEHEKCKLSECKKGEPDPGLLADFEKRKLKPIKPKKERQLAPENKKKIAKVKGRIGPRYIESIMLDEQPYFLAYNTTQSKIELIPELEYLDRLYQPLEPQDYGYFPYSFTSQEIESLITKKIEKEELLDEIKKYTDHFINANELEKNLIVGDIFITYCYEWVNTLHYPYFVGETESGKSSALHLFKWLAYRYLYSEDLPNADVYNFLGTDEEGTGTIGEDEAQDLERNRDKISTYKNSYSKGSTKPRVITTPYGKHQVHHKTFCLKAFAGERVPQNKGFIERLAIVHMVQGHTKGNIKRTTPQEVEALKKLRNQILIWKIQNLTNLSIQNHFGLQLRDQELWEDFLTIAYNTKYFEKFKNVVTYFTEQRHEAIRNSFEARVFKLLQNKLDEKFEVNALAFWEYIISDNPEMPGRLDDKKGTFYPEDYSKFTKNSLSRLLEDKFQGQKRSRYEKDKDNPNKYHKKTFYSFKSDVLEKLATKYGLSEIDSSGQGSQSCQNTLEPFDHPEEQSSSGLVKQEYFDNSDHLDDLGK